MKICIVTLWDQGCKEYAQLSDKSKQLYAQKHGYTFIAYHYTIYKDKPAVWSKMPAILNIIDNYDYVVWIDADAIIANPQFKLQGILKDKDIYVSKDINGVNFGVFAVKNSQTAKNFLREVDASYPVFRFKVFKEQAAAAHLIDSKYADCTQIVPCTMWNSYDNVYPHYIDNEYKEGDFILHLPNNRALQRVRSHYRYNRFKEILHE